jgi:hypothetical protein
MPQKHRMPSLLALISFALAPPAVQAHPGPGIVIDGGGQIYFVHPRRHRIMKIDAAGKLTTFVQGEDGKTLSVPHHLVIDVPGNLYSCGDRDSAVWKISPAGKLTKVYPSAGASPVIGSGGDPFSRDAMGNLYAVGGEQFKRAEIIRIGPDGKSAVLAGGEWGYADSKGAAAKFGNLHGAGFAWGVDGSLLLTDSGTSVRKIAVDGTVRTLAGGAKEGFADGASAAAKFNGACGVALDAEGNILVADAGNRRIRKIGRSGQVSTLPNKTAFEEPAGVAVGKDGVVYVLDYSGDDPRVRRLKPDGTVTTIAEGN